VANEALAGSAPSVLGEDAQSGLFAMEFLPEERYPLWKTLLRDGVISSSAAEQVGHRIGALHSYSAARPDLAGQFATDHIFYPIRLDPYLGATARAHPDLADRLLALIRATATTKLALVHGDVSPKNILLGPQGPVFLDAECAWFGDPAFDLAFCLNHFLLKCLWRPQWRAQYLECFEVMIAAYRSHIDWEAPDTLEIRAAHLLPGLFLARIDGKSTVEYVSAERDKSLVRQVARQLILHPVNRLGDIRSIWSTALEQRG
jgi:aminoglycoside phosphotransferase (APT) family kinase protein